MGLKTQHTRVVSTFAIFTAYIRIRCVLHCVVALCTLSMPDTTALYRYEAAYCSILESRQRHICFSSTRAIRVES